MTLARRNNRKEKWGKNGVLLGRVGGESQSHDGTDGSDKTHRARGVPEDLDLILGATSGLSSGLVEGPIRKWKWRGQLGIRCHDPDCGGEISLHIPGCGRPPSRPPPRGRVYL